MLEVSRFYLAIIALFTIPSDSVLLQTERVSLEPVSCAPTSKPVMNWTLFNGFNKTFTPFGVDTGAGFDAAHCVGSVQSTVPLFVLLLVLLLVVLLVELLVVLLVELLVVLLVVLVVLLLVVLVVLLVVFAVRWAFLNLYPLLLKSEGSCYLKIKIMLASRPE